MEVPVQTVLEELALAFGFVVALLGGFYLQERRGRSKVNHTRLKNVIQMITMMVHCHATVEFINTKLRYLFVIIFGHLVELVASVVVSGVRGPRLQIEPAEVMSTHARHVVARNLVIDVDEPLSNDSPEEAK